MATTAAASPIKRIAVIGAGPTGIACAKFFVAEEAFSTIDIFEQRQNIGGIWNLSSNERSKHIPVPQNDPDYSTGGKDEDHPLEFESPLYDYLETNIPKSLMAYSDLAFGQDLPLFPRHDEVLRYLEQYAEPVSSMVKFETQVIDVQAVSNESAVSSSRLDQEWIAVVVANGHYTVPHIPSIPGIKEFNERYPDVIMHSKAYRRPEDYTGKKVLVIGNSASGLDISAQIATCAQQPVYLASRSASQLAPTGGGPSWRKDVPEIQEFIADGSARAVRSKDGQVHSGFDTIIFATGYYYSYPFLSKASAGTDTSSQSVSPSESATSLDSVSRTDNNHDDLEPKQPFRKMVSPFADLVTSGLRTHHVYKHFLHMDYPTLALPVLNLKIIPFPLGENQAAVLARLWSGRLDLSTRGTMQDWEQEEEQRLLKANRLRQAPDTASGDSATSTLPKSGAAKYEGGFHTLVYPEDANQINTLYAWAASARKKDSLRNEGVGKLGTRWNEKDVWLRGRFPDIKAAYTKHGDKRFGITSLEALGDEWKEGFARWQRETTKENQAELFRKAGVESY
ncbi:monooxygenase [Lithohypha guttulata]|uniref:monooxygenase n=1 Tax=Lithohypha guttulata TaxID=1690604 RepID=UPI002DE18827|nr:monooxygenase [Lithohypha guttulata]